MPRDVIMEAFDQGEALVEEYEELKGRRRANRDLLRNFDTGGMLSNEQAVYLNDELYPPRKRGGSDEEQ